jgi:insulysin
LEHYKEIVKAFFQYVSLLRDQPPQEWIFEEQKGIADVNFKFKQKSPAMRFVMRTSAVMQKPLPRKWLLSGESRLRKFDSKLIQKAINCLRVDNFRITIVSQHFPGDWDKREKWYGTEYKVEKIPRDFMDEIKEAAAMAPGQRLEALHLPHHNDFIPTNFDVEKKEVEKPAIEPRLVRNDAHARTWFKKDDTFWVPKANVIVNFRSPIIYASAATAVKTRIYTDLVKDALEEYAYDADLAGLQYSVSYGPKALFLDVSGYNDKLSVLLAQVLKTMRDLEIKEDRFEIVKERLKRAYDNAELQMSYHQVGDYIHWLGAERAYIVEEFAAELPTVTAEAVRCHKRQLLGQMHIELYAHGNLYKKDAMHLTDLIQSTLNPRPLPQTQWPVNRALIFPPGSNYVYQRTLKDPANVNHCIEYLLFTGDKGDRVVRAKTLLLDQMVNEPAYDQLRTKEQLGYIVFSGARNLSTQYGFRFLIQSERLPQYLESRVDAFIELFSEQLQEMNDEEFEAHKRSLIVRRLKKLENLDAESSKHWSQIATEYLDFDIGKCRLTR